MTDAVPVPAAPVTPAQAGRTYQVAARILQPIARATSKQDWAGLSQLDRPSGLLLVANHISNYDFLAIADFVNAAGRAVRFLAKESLFGLPVVGSLIRRAGQIPVRRASADARNALAATISAVQAGECVIVYPEGTLTSDPDGWPMVGKTGAARVALATGVPVIPLGQWGAADVLPRGGKVPHLWPRRTVRVRAGDPIDLAAHLGRDVDAAALREVTELFMRSIGSLVGELRGEEPPALRWDPVRRERV